ncbi:ABC transporter ATP-binding protein [Kyrpidia spormannii]|uniref:Carnitine transport ATP-binding protein OpuCA n=2 Tax=Kyrpidia spormannii TaxID=2055160 RepID=A0A6F9E1L3_9BACL|nr:ABC transporter ATP-binding protein [Kyrpidia spormannii]CAB3390712.1 Spermidine/putrescine import ATP-binding protein PotA [Kyrpidia spormannii]CAB3391626.1 Spermidine/putrescine import ATP-binding protein PotA [Kyrpidia spormannii]
MSHLVLDGVVKRFHDREVIHGVHLSVERGELMCFLGPSGCGKTTILNMIAGFLAVDAGEIRLDGVSVEKRPSHKRNMGMVFQNYALFPHMTVFENIAFGLKLRKVDKAAIREQVGRVLELTRLTGYEDHYPRQLSGGQQQRVAMARALVIRPDVLLLDEPFSNLDAKLRQEMREEVFEIQRRIGITTIFVTHDQEEAMAISDRIAVIHNGVIEQVGAPREIYEEPRTDFVATFIGEVNALSGRVAGNESRGWVSVATDFGERFSGRSSGAELPVGAEVTLYVRPEHMRIQGERAFLDSGDGGGSGTSSGSGLAHPGAGLLRGRVDRIVFLGVRTRYVVDTPAGVITVQTAEPPVGLETGSAVVVQWDPDRAFVIPKQELPGGTARMGKEGGPVEASG